MEFIERDRTTITQLRHDLHLEHNEQWKMLASWFPTSNPPDPGLMMRRDPFPWRPPPLQDQRLIWLRNYALFATLFEVFSCIIGLILNVVRRSRITQLFNLTLLFTSSMGFYGSATLRIWLCYLHALLTFLFACLFLAFLVWQTFFVEEEASPALILMHLMFTWDLIVALIVLRLFLHLRAKSLAAQRNPVTPPPPPGAFVTQLAILLYTIIDSVIFSSHSLHEYQDITIKSDCHTSNINHLLTNIFILTFCACILLSTVVEAGVGASRPPITAEDVSLDSHSFERNGVNSSFDMGIAIVLVDA
eukprot:g74469.t1